MCNTPEQPCKHCQKFYPETKPRPHADLIKAWADGAQIEMIYGGEWRECPSPSFQKDIKYRIKPTKEIKFTVQVTFEDNQPINVTIGKEFYNAI